MSRALRPRRKRASQPPLLRLAWWALARRPLRRIPIRARHPSTTRCRTQRQRRTRSYGSTATSTRQMGDLIEFGGTSRDLESVTVGMNSWACETGSLGGVGEDACVTTPGSHFNEAITVHFYEVGVDGAVGNEITSKTDTFAIRSVLRPRTRRLAPAPSGSTRCAGTCENGMTVPVTFDFSDTDLVLPNDVIVSITYPTSRFGELAQGPWDSLNLDTVATAPSVGTDVDSDVLYVDSDWANMYDGGPTGTFRATTNYTGTALNIKISAKPSSAAVQMGTVLGDFGEPRLDRESPRRRSAEQLRTGGRLLLRRRSRDELLHSRHRRLRCHALRRLRERVPRGWLLGVGRLLPRR